MDPLGRTGQGYEDLLFECRGIISRTQIKQRGQRERATPGHQRGARAILQGHCDFPGVACSDDELRHACLVQDFEQSIPVRICAHADLHTLRRYLQRQLLDPAHVKLFDINNIDINVLQRIPMVQCGFSAIQLQGLQW